MKNAMKDVEGHMAKYGAYCAGTCKAAESAIEDIQQEWLEMVPLLTAAIEKGAVAIRGSEGGGKIAGAGIDAGHLAEAVEKGKAYGNDG